MELLHVVELIGLKGVYCGPEDLTAKARRRIRTPQTSRSCNISIVKLNMTTGRGQNQSDTLSVVRRYSIRLKGLGPASDPTLVESNPIIGQSHRQFFCIQSAVTGVDFLLVCMNQKPSLGPICVFPN
jgi:hypothetical protein